MQIKKKVSGTVNTNMEVGFIWTSTITTQHRKKKDLEKGRFSDVTAGVDISDSYNIFKEGSRSTFTCEMC
jgi:molybdopterin-binding protein